MNITDVIPLLTAFGLGSVMTSFIQSWIKRREWLETRNFRERKDAYVGLLEAYHKAAVENTDAAAKEFAYWQMRCELVAPETVRNAISQIVKTNNDPAKRYVAHEHLKVVMRDDLGIDSAKRPFAN